MNPNYWIDKVAEAEGGCSDYRISQVLGISKQSVSAYRKGTTKTLDEAVAHRVEVRLGLKPGTVMLDQLSERATDPEVREIWKRLGKIVAGVAATILVTAGLSVGAPTRAIAAFSGEGARVVPPVIIIGINGHGFRCDLVSPRASKINPSFRRFKPATCCSSPSRELGFDLVRRNQIAGVG
jgi:hypothetical protein